MVVVRAANARAVGGLVAENGQGTQISGTADWIHTKLSWSMASDGGR